MVHSHLRRGVGRAQVHFVSDSACRGASIPAKIEVRCEPQSRHGDHDSILGVHSELSAKAVA